MTRVLTITVLFFLIGSSADAQNILPKLKQRFDELKPKGTLIKQILGLDQQPASHSHMQNHPQAQSILRQPKPPAPTRSSIPNTQSQANSSSTKSSPVPLAPSFTKTDATPASTTLKPTHADPKTRTIEDLEKSDIDTPLADETNIDLSLDPADPESKAKELGVQFEQTNNGVVITSIIKNSPAEQAGLQVNDIIQYFAGMRITNADEVLEVAGALGTGDQVEMDVFRLGKRVNLLLTVNSEVAPNHEVSVMPSQDLDVAPRETPIVPNIINEIDNLRETIRTQNRIIAELKQQIETSGATN